MMRLSEAIRLGAVLKPQAHDGTIISETHTCALGAAIEGAGIPARALDKGELMTTGRGHGEARGGEQAYTLPVEWMKTMRRISDSFFCPVQYCTDFLSMCSGARIIAHLNDSHKWTREQIADYVEQFEEKSNEETCEEVREHVASVDEVCGIHTADRR